MLVSFKNTGAVRIWFLSNDLCLLKLQIQIRFEFSSGSMTCDRVLPLELSEKIINS